MIVFQKRFVILPLLAYNKTINPTTNHVSDTHGVNSARRYQIYMQLSDCIDITLRL